MFIHLTAPIVIKVYVTVYVMAALFILSVGNKKSIVKFLPLSFQLNVNQLKLYIMKQNGSPRCMTNSVLGSLYVLFLLLCSSVSSAQSPTDFSGAWIQDTSKSDDFYKSLTYGKEDVGFTEEYSLSGNGFVLTVQKSDIIPGGLSTKLVFNKK